MRMLGVVNKGNGMTIKLLPVFFAEEVGLSPIAVNLTMAAMPIALAICTLVAGQMSHHVGELPCFCILLGRL